MNTKETSNNSQTLAFPILRLLWAFVAVLLVFVSAAWYIYVSDYNTLRNALAWLTVFALDVSSILIFTGFIFSFPIFYNLYHSVSPNVRRLLVILLLFSLILVSFIAPRTNRIYFDEHIYQGIAQSIMHTRHAYMANEADAELGSYKAFSTEYNKQPNGFPYYLSIFFKLFGVHEKVAHFANYFAYLACIVCVFGIAYILFQSEKAGIYAAMFYSMTPIVVIWSATASAEPAASFFASFAIFIAALYAKELSASLLLLLAGVIGFAVTIRPESILLILPVSLLLLLYVRTKIFQPKFIYFALTTSLLILPELIHLIAIRDEPWGSDSTKFSFDVFSKNFPVNSMFYFFDPVVQRFPIIFTLFAVVGILFGGQYRAKLPLFIWFLFSWGIFLFFYAGSYNFGVDVRFSIISAAPLALFAGYGAMLVNKIISSKLRENYAAIIVVGIIILFWIPFLPFIRAIGTESMEARESISLAHDLIDLVPSNSMVLSHIPSIWLINGKNASQTSIATFQKQHVINNLFKRYRGGIYFHNNYWCNVPNPTQNRFCENIFENFETELIKEKTGVNNFKISLYRLFPKSVDLER
jgi:4-amino-4-deoxy-L-arabinose transferase-like glycosyltransferase